MLRGLLVLNIAVTYWSNLEVSYNVQQFNVMLIKLSLSLMFTLCTVPLSMCMDYS